MNILYTHRTRGRGAEGVHIREIVEALREEKHNVQVISAPGADPFRKSAPSAKVLRSRPTGWSYFSSYAPQLVFEAAELLYNGYLYWQCAQAQKKEKIDFIYERYALNTFATVLFAKRNRIPIILEINDATGIERTRKHWLEGTAQRIEKWIFSNADHLLTISSEFQRILISRGVPWRKVSFHPNAANLRKFDPKRGDGGIRERLGISDKIVVGFVGSFAAWHGIDLLREVIPRIAATNPRVHFLLVGNGVSFPDFLAWVRNCRLVNTVTLTDRIPDHRIPEYIAAMDIGLIPNSNRYGSPMKLFEYLAMGAVPVVPDLPPMRDVVVKSRTAMFFPPRDTDMMATQLEKLIADDNLRARMSNAAIKLARERHTWQHNASRILKIFNSINQKKER